MKSSHYKRSPVALLSTHRSFLTQQFCPYRVTGDPFPKLRLPRGKSGKASRTWGCCVTAFSANGLRRALAAFGKTIDQLSRGSKEKLERTSLKISAAHLSLSAVHRTKRRDFFKLAVQQCHRRSGQCQIGKDRSLITHVYRQLRKDKRLLSVSNVIGN